MYFFGPWFRVYAVHFSLSPWLIRWTTFLFSVHCYIVLPRNRKKVDSKSVLRILGVWWLMFGWCFPCWMIHSISLGSSHGNREWVSLREERVRMSEKEAGVPGYVLGAKCATCLSRIRYREKKMAVLIHGGSKAAMRSPAESHLPSLLVHRVYSILIWKSTETDGTGKVSFWTKMSMCKMYWWKYITICILSTCGPRVHIFFQAWLCPDKGVHGKLYLRIPKLSQQSQISSLAK